jgi:hypothetical protein
LVTSFLFIFFGAQYFIVSAFVYAKLLPEFILIPSFFVPLLIGTILRKGSSEKIALILATSTLVGLPAVDGDVFGVADPAGSLFGVGTFTVLALVFGVRRLIEQRHNYVFFLLIAEVPLFACGLSLLFLNRWDYLVASEFLKFLSFLCFVAYAVTARFSQKTVLFLLPLTFLVVLIAALVLHLLFGVGYFYGGSFYAYVPISVFIIPVICLLTPSKEYAFLSACIAALLVLGQIQPSAKIIILLVFAAFFISNRQLGIVGSMIAGVLLSVSILVSYPMWPDGLRHKGMSVLLLISGGYRELGPAFFYTSAGNILAELMAIIESLRERLFLPLGAGFGIVDHDGRLGLANKFAYPESAFLNGVFYPLHLGAFYLIAWYGILVPVLLPLLRQKTLFLIFCLTGMTYKPLLFLAAAMPLWNPRSVHRHSSVYVQKAKPLEN